jgi:hypothetical protein
MCDPMTAATAAMIGGSAVSSMSSIVQARQNTEIAEYNAAVDRNKATSIENKAIRDAIDVRTSAVQKASSQRAAAAARGAVVDFGTALDLTEDTTMIGEVDAARIKETASEEAQYLRDAADFSVDAAKSAETQAMIGGIGSFLTSAGTVGMKWYSM